MKYFDLKGKIMHIIFCPDGNRRYAEKNKVSFANKFPQDITKRDFMRLLFLLNTKINSISNDSMIVPSFRLVG